MTPTRSSNIGHCSFQDERHETKNTENHKTCEKAGPTVSECDVERVSAEEQQEQVSQNYFLSYNGSRSLKVKP